ncbi:PD40 domain-containing protein [Bdellovibrio bacteriovorus]|uniref:Adventurous gliding motility protein W n=1 Tax=Bdellovibrio bacteriovorus str. Tiberius TaxID=1069642 RepID=K7YJN5_BDEBC|nr:PD40 domain-containing protein [Bdellovibrio bacteriovorus]AFX99875.1 adventurous gliding motility protein W [Bdellovibrio bacteriovorus str. Tiberius]
MMKQILALVLTIGLFPLFSHAQNNNGIYIKLGEARTKKSLMAFPPLQYTGSPSTASRNQSVGVEIFNTITNDLTVSSYFQFINQSAFLEDTSKTGLMPAPGLPNGFKFQSWSSIGADFLIRAGYSVVGNEVTLETYTYHVPRAALVLGKKYKGPTSSARRIAHTFANDVMKALTGVEGPFLSRVVASSDKGSGQSKEIFTMDWDGANMEQVSSHRSISISPAWSPDGKKIAYTSYVKRVGAKFRNADMLLLDLTTGKRSLISYRQGINSGASFSADGKHIYLTISQGNSPDIYKMGLDGTLVGKITNGPAGALNVEPTVSPQGLLSFSSDRAGRPMIYTADAAGNNVKRITFAGVFNSSPSWSPDGKKIAFAGQSDNNFDIFVMNADGTGMIRLTSAKKPNGRMASNEDPSFSPDGRFVMYTSNRTGKNQIYISTVDGTEERRVTNDNNNYYKPKWSNNID